MCITNVYVQEVRGRYPNPEGIEYTDYIPLFTA